MSGKYTNQKQQKMKRRMLLAVLCCLAAVCAAVCWLLTEPQPVADDGTQPPVTTTETPTAAGTVETKPVRVDEIEAVSIDLGFGMRISDVGRYTGVYMEDGSDEIVSGVMMIAVTNEGDDVIQYAEISLPVGEKTARFSLSTLPAGATVILLEQTRMEYVPGEYSQASASNVAVFSAPLSLCEDRLQIQIMDGAINVTNISGADIDGDIIIYYKNSAADVYYGGITYRVRLEGGMRAGEVRQIMASHFSDPGSAIMFVTCGET